MKDIYITTHTGKKFFPFAPKPEDVDILDIAHSLSNINRWIGHTNRPYSVAEHSLLVAELLKENGMSEDIQLWGLLHDASEAYFGDIASPIKQQFKVIMDFEEGIQRAIAEHFKLQWPIPDEVHKADRRALEIEADNLFLRRPTWRNVIDRAEENRIKIVSPPTIKEDFINRFIALGGGVGKRHSV